MRGNFSPISYGRNETNILLSILKFVPEIHKGIFRTADNAEANVRKRRRAYLKQSILKATGGEAFSLKIAGATDGVELSREESSSII